MRSRVVIGANYGDEGKGLVVDYLCSSSPGAGAVVRFNGGAQAGHTVVTPEGERHVFHHVGSGAFCDVPTFLSEFFVVNPIALFTELDELAKLGVHPNIFASPECVVTTFADMIINQRKEDARGDKRHGSVGLGIHETMQRSQVSTLSITMADLWNGPERLKGKLAEICGRWARYRTGSPIERPEAMIEAFVKGCTMLAEVVAPAGIGQCSDPVFEGAQGLLLDQGQKAAWPHVTHSNTGIKNVLKLCRKAGWVPPAPSDVYYVSRTYLTRHGAGPLPGENPKMSFPDDTNVPHDYQGSLRFAPLDADALFRRCAADCGSDGYRVVYTHCDQLAPPDTRWKLRASGPTRNNVEVNT